jgi:hypothetical protein
MSSDLQRFLRAVRTLAKLARTYGDEAVLDALGQHATLKQEGDVRFVGGFLDDIGKELYERSGDPVPHCRQCDKEICNDVRYNDRDPRADAQYCGPACRQKAYRSRVTANTAKHNRKRNGKGISLRLGQQKPQRAVTQTPTPEPTEDAQAHTTTAN